MKKTLSIIIAALLSIPIFSSVNIRGRVVDSQSKEPIEFVSVAIYKIKSDKPIRGSLTNENGVFNIGEITDGDYELRVSFVGYLPFSKSFSVNGKAVNLRDILLKEDTKILKEVEVVAQGMQMRFDIDKKVFSVDQNIASAGGSAGEVLENIPSVEVDNDGNISLRNTQSVEIYINEKPAGLTAENRAQVLQRMPAEDIESIEVMTNPSAKYSPEGTAGIINLVMKKNRKSGYYGSVSSGITLQNGKVGGNAGANINYNVGKLNAFANLGYRNGKRLSDNSVFRKNYNRGDTTFLSQKSTNDMNSSGLFFRGGVDYNISNKHTIGVAGFTYNGSPKFSSNTNYLLTTPQPETTLREFFRDNSGYFNHSGYNVNLNHKYEIDNLGSSLISSLSYSAHTGESFGRYSEKNITPLNIDEDISQTAANYSKSIEFKTDYTKKFNENNRLELGWNSNWSSRFSKATGFDERIHKDIYQYYNQFDYTEQVHATYATYGTRINNLSIQGGLRAEYLSKNSTSTSKDSLLKLDDFVYPKQSYLEFFPSIYLGYSLPNNNELQLNYTRRINRPRGRMINSFKDYSDPTNISYGNPELMPEFTSAFELNYLKSWTNHSISASTYYRHNNDKIMRVRFINPDRAIESTYMNLTDEHNVGLELVSRNRLFKIVNLTSSFNAYYHLLESSLYTNSQFPDIKVVIPEQKNFSYAARVMANVMISPTFTGQFTGSYRSEQITAQGKQESLYTIDLGLRKTFFNRKLSLNLNVRDLLNSRGKKGTTYGDGFYQYSERKGNGRMYGLTLTYNFGNQKPKRMERNQRNESLMDESGGFGMDSDE